MRTLRDKVRVMAHHLRMLSMSALDEDKIPGFVLAVKKLPSPEAMSSMPTEILEALSRHLEGIMSDVDKARITRTVDHDIRHRVRTGLPMRREPVLGSSVNWYKRASIEQEKDWSKHLHPSWNVIKRGDELFELRFDKIPILDFSLTTRPDGKLDGNIKERHTYGNNLLTKIPEGVRSPMTIEIFSRAVDTRNAEQGG